jgi:hypothetical protein
MMPPASRTACRVTGGLSCRCWLLAGLLALAPAWPSPAYAYTLDELLSLPLERLLRLEISPRLAVQVSWHGARTPGAGSVNGGRHAA